VPWEASYTNTIGLIKIFILKFWLNNHNAPLLMKIEYDKHVKIW